MAEHSPRAEEWFHIKLVRGHAVDDRLVNANRSLSSRIPQSFISGHNQIEGLLFAIAPRRSASNIAKNGDVVKLAGKGGAHPSIASSSNFLRDRLDPNEPRLVFDAFVSWLSALGILAST